MQIHINREGQSLGQFSPDEVRWGYQNGKFTATDLAWREGMAVWRPLGEVVDEIAPATAPADLPSPAPLPTGTPWESRDQVGFFVGLFETVRTFLLEPKATFEAMRPNGGLGAPLFFFFIMSLLGLLAGVAYQVLAQTIQGTGASDGQPLALIFRSGFFTGLTIIVTPVFLIAGVFFTSGLLHLALMLVGGANRPFEATFRVVCYAGGATAVLQLLPLCGGIAASVYNLVLLVIGISTVQAISKARTITAIFLPALVCCGIFILSVAGSLAYLGSAYPELFEQIKEAMEQFNPSTR